MKLLVVSKYPVSKKFRPLLDFPEDTEVTYIGLSRDETGEEIINAKGMKSYFSWWLDESLEDFDAILALGNEGLVVTTGHSGIMKYRGRDFTYGDIPVMASISPAAIDRTPSLGALLRADIDAMFRRVSGETVEGVEPDRIRIVGTTEVLGILYGHLDNAKAVAFDLETSGYDETQAGALIVSIALTIEDELGELTCWAVPLCHEDSPWEFWVNILRTLATHMRKVPVRIGHNAKFDCRWLVQFGAAVPCNFDTMLAAHMLDENRAKGLKPLARMLLGAPEWDIAIKPGTKAEILAGRGEWYQRISLADILHYNGLDTWHTFKLYQLFVTQLQKDSRVMALFQKLMMPASQSFVHIERNGAYVDYQRLKAGAELVKMSLDTVEDQLLLFVPPDPPYPVNWNRSKFLLWLLFEHLGLPVLSRTPTGGIQVNEETMQHLADQGHEIAKTLLGRVAWQKLHIAFFTPYLELLTSESRLHTTFKLTGTATGRSSSGKADEEKVTGSRDIRGVNLQQVPRMTLCRSIFSAPPGWKRVDADYSQLELRLAAEVAEERHMLSLYALGEDIHTTMAMRMTGKTADKVTKEERTKAKAVNFGFLYGMGPDKFITTSYKDYGVVVTPDEAESFYKAFFQQYPDLRAWHTRQKRLVHKYKRVQTPLGRVRHLPDIDSPDIKVVHAAERQAINSPIQGFGADLTLLSTVVLHRRFLKAGMRTAIVGNVHDAISFEIPDEELSEALPMIKAVMENPPTHQLFGYRMRVPLVADLSVGTHWGEQKEVNV